MKNVGIGMLYLHLKGLDLIVKHLRDMVNFVVLGDTNLLSLTLIIIPN